MRNDPEELSPLLKRMIDDLVERLIICEYHATFGYQQEDTGAKLTGKKRGYKGDGYLASCVDEAADYIRIINITLADAIRLRVDGGYGMHEEIKEEKKKQKVRKR